MITYSSFSLRDAVARVIPGALFLILFVQEMDPLKNCLGLSFDLPKDKNYQLLLLTLLAYPVGLGSEYAARIFRKHIIDLWPDKLWPYLSERKYRDIFTGKKDQKRIAYNLYENEKTALIGLFERILTTRYFFANIWFLSIVLIFFKLIIVWWICKKLSLDFVWLLIPLIAVISLLIENFEKKSFYDLLEKCSESYEDPKKSECKSRADE